MEDNTPPNRAARYFGAGLAVLVYAVIATVVITGLIKFVGWAL